MTRRQDVLDGAVHSSVAILLTIQCVQTITLARANSDEGSVAGFITLAGTQALLAITMVIAVIARRSVPLAPMLAIAAIGAVAAGSAEWVRTAPMSMLAAHIVPSNAMQCVQGITLACSRRLRTFGWVVLACGPAYLGLMALGPGTISWTRFDEWIMPSGSTLAMAVVVAHLRRVAVQGDAAAAHDLAARSDAALTANAAAAQDEARRLVHDHVISALRSVEVQDDVRVVRDSCHRALDAIVHLDPVRSADELAAAFRDIPGVRARSMRRWPLAVPERVLHALRDAAHEAVRNAQRHSGTTQVEVRTLSTARGQVAVEVADAGVGFDPGHQRLGFGTSQSIAGRLAAVGGNAEIESAPGAGTTVRLTWPALPDTASGGIPLTWGREPRSRFYVTMLAPLVLVNGYLSLRHPGSSPLASFALAVVVGAVTLLSAWRFGRRPPTRRALVVLTALGAAATWAGLHLAGPGSLMSLRSWIVGYCADLLAVIGLEAPLGSVLVVIACQVATVVAYAAQDPTITAFEPVGALLTPVALGALAAALGVALRRGDRRLQLDHAVQRARAEEAGWQDHLAAARQRYLTRVTGEIAQFLASMDDAGVVDDSLRQQAAVLAQRCRDDLLHTEPLPADLADVVAQARATGVVVNLRAGAVDHPRCRTLLASVLRNSSPRSVTAVAASALGPARLVVVPPLDGSAVRAIEAGLPASTVTAVEHDDVCTRLAVR